MVQEIQSKTVLTYHADAFPTHWDLNPYRGCTIGCKYCFAQYSHKYLGLDDFFRDILVKTNVAERLDAELKKKGRKLAQLKIGGTTDLYQHIEKKYELLPQIYDIVKKHKTPVFIQTKSTLILRDFEIIRELSKIATVDICTSISTFDESLRRIIEPGAAPAMERAEMLARFKGICRSTTLGFMPVIPLLSDTDSNLETAFRVTKQLKIDNIVTSFLFLRGEVKSRFLQLMELHFPDLYPDFCKLYSRPTVDPVYYRKTMERLELLRAKYELYGTFKPVESNYQAPQLSLF